MDRSHADLGRYSPRSVTRQHAIGRDAALEDRPLAFRPPATFYLNSNNGHGDDGDHDTTTRRRLPGGASRSVNRYERNGGGGERGVSTGGVIGDGCNGGGETAEFASAFWTAPGEKLCDMGDSYPQVAVYPLRRSAECKTEEEFDESSGGGSGVAYDAYKVGGDVTKADYARHKYDDQIDPNLSPSEKKKQRRILANRASARRSRERKKQTMARLMEDQRELIRQRDTAMAELKTQAQLNEDLRREMEAMRCELNAYRASGRPNGVHARSPEMFDAPSDPQPFSSADEEVMSWRSKLESDELFEACFSTNWKYDSHRDI